MQARLQPSRRVAVTGGPHFGAVGTVLSSPVTPTREAEAAAAAVAAARAAALKERLAAAEAAAARASGEASSSSAAAGGASAAASAEEERVLEVVPAASAAVARLVLRREGGDVQAAVEALLGGGSLEALEVEARAAAAGRGAMGFAYDGERELLGTPSVRPKLPKLPLERTRSGSGTRKPPTKPPSRSKSAPGMASAEGGLGSEPPSRSGSREGPSRTGAARPSSGAAPRAAPGSADRPPPTESPPSNAGRARRGLPRVGSGGGDGRSVGRHSYEKYKRATGEVGAEAVGRGARTRADEASTRDGRVWLGVVARGPGGACGYT